MHYYPYPQWVYPYSDPRWLFNNNLQPQTVLSPPNPFPSINTQVLNTSAHSFQELLKQADLLAGKIVNSKEFAHDLMEAAQLSNTKKVDELILSTGITLKIKTYFSPTGIRIELTNAGNEGSCCNLLMTLKW
ncbi:hypothetical protein GGGNBK_12190 [Sporosarcina sp. ANT_H38]|uniref:hypothetical protein n=1 Tax=Sporosarcina sp. ANT_H38 TaxID=2597358 RepID=UPI002102E374|nr:hypothetical protein [Sporosarcina sp. ANT_H38]